MLCNVCFLLVVALATLKFCLEIYLAYLASHNCHFMTRSLAGFWVKGVNSFTPVD